MRAQLLTSLALLLVLSGGYASPVSAQDLTGGAKSDEKSDSSENSSLVRVKDWTIKREVDTLTSSMKQFNGLIRSLSKANSELGKEFKKYLNDPNNELLASRVEKKLAQYAANVSKEFNAIIASQDVFTSNFRNLRHKLKQLSVHLKGKSVEFKNQLLEYKKKSKEYKGQLITLANKIKDPDLTEAERAKLKREFQLIHRRYRMQNRYLKGYTSRYKGYLRLQQNMGGLGNLFGSLHGKFEDLITNLENEKKYLKASIELQADSLRIKKLIREGIVGGEKAIVNVSKKLATLYVKVDTFNEVHDRISQQMNRFVDSQGSLLNVTDKINSIGAGGATFGGLNKDLDKLIDEFAQKDPDAEEEVTSATEKKTEGGKGEK